MVSMRTRVVRGCPTLLRHILTLGVIVIAGVCRADVESLRCEYLASPIGIDAASPRLSWIMASHWRNEMQTAYQVLVASSPGLLKEDRGDLWDSGKVASDESAQISYQGRALTSRASCLWKVRIWDRDGNPSRWSPTARWEMGLLQRQEWSAKWIIAETPGGSPATSVPYLQKPFAFFGKWLLDVADGQSPEGAFRDINPTTMKNGGAPGWGDAGVICPWTLYETYGDKRILEQHLPEMIRWVEYLRLHSHDLIREKDRGNDYGDWLSIGADTPKDLIGTAFFAYSTHLVAMSCAALGRTEEAVQYENLFQDIKAAFIKRYVAADGRIRGETQSAYALALKFDLLPEDLRPKAAQHLEDDIIAKGGHLSTGFLGVGCLLPVLTRAGKADTAYRLLLQDTFPSWLFSVKHGATTIWERWDGWTPDRGFQDPGMNSFNHYSLGSCGEYLFGLCRRHSSCQPGLQNDSH
jgi:hypothetical protein